MMQFLDDSSNKIFYNFKFLKSIVIDSIIVLVQFIVKIMKLMCIQF